MSQPIIDVRNISKRYRLGTIGMTSIQEELDRMRQAIRRRWLKSTAADPGANGNGSAHPGEFWALRDVSFDVGHGDVVGIIGRNGAGKSTLLKILSRITQQTEGEITLRGRVASLLEVGTGFHPELSGRENIFLNGAILGMTKAEIERRFDAIVAFAEIAKFLDTPVKRYSSGMYVRLAFAVAAHLETDILVIDEVLAVGDAAFQTKCLDKMGEVSASGRTVLFVSHNLSAVQGLCKRAVWLDRGRVAANGPVHAVAAKYLEAVSLTGTEQREVSHDSQDPLRILQVILRGESGQPTLTLRPWESLDIEVVYSCREALRAPHFWITVDSQFGALFGANMLLDGRRPEWIVGRGSLRCRFQSMSLLPQSYTVTVGVRDESGMRNLCPPEAATMFSIVGSSKDYDLHGEVSDALVGNSSPLLVPYEWQFDDGSIATPAWLKLEREQR